MGDNRITWRERKGELRIYEQTEGEEALKVVAE